MSSDGERDRSIRILVNFSASPLKFNDALRGDYVTVWYRGLMSSLTAMDA